jgi:hypothetical protein
MPHCFSPTLETWLLAISRGHFITWPGLHHRQCTPLLTQIRGHRKRTPRPTTQEFTLNKTKPLSDIEADYHPTPETEQTNLVFAAVLDYETGNISFILT